MNGFEETIYFEIFCFEIVFIGFIVVVIVLSTRARFREAKQIMKNYKRGAYKNWSQAPIANRMRILLGRGWIATGISLGSLLLYSIIPFHMNEIATTIFLIINAILFIIGMISFWQLNRMVMKPEDVERK